MPGIKIQQLDKNEPSCYTLSGFADDLSDFSSLLTSPHQSFVLDLAGIEEINSYGVKLWSQFLVHLKSRQVTYRRCRPSLIRQMNVVINLRRNIKIESFYVPFECTSCLIETEELYGTHKIMEVGLDYFLTRMIFDVSCTRCAGTMTFMDDEESYFKFLRSP